MLTFSIITPTVMRLTLLRTCRSVEEQRCASWQHLVMVDKPEAALTVTEAEMLRQLAHPQREIRYCSPAHGDSGNSCRSIAWEYAIGDYILYVDDDDYLLPEALDELQQDLGARDALPVWGVFPIQRFGQRFLLIPPGHSRTCSTQFFHQRRADGTDLRFPIAGYCADGVFVDTLMARFPYVCIDPGRPLAVVDQRNLGARATIDRGQFESAFRDYVQNYSIETEAISLEASYYLLEVLATLPVARILDLGSGWSSFVFRYFRHFSGRDVEICSVDTSEHWRAMTASFLNRHGVDAERLCLWPDVGDGLYDLVFVDIGRPWERPAHLDVAFDRAARTLILDDMHYAEYQRACALHAAARGLEMQLLVPHTTDRFGRFLGRVDLRPPRGHQ